MAPSEPEPEPASELELVLEPEPASEPELVLEPEPASEPELVAEPEPVAEPELVGGLSAQTKSRAVRALAIWNFAFDQARGNFAHQADQNLALALCQGNSVRTVQLQTYVTSASAVAQFASNQIIGQWCDTFGRKPLLVGFPVLIAVLRLAVAAMPCWPTLFAAELANYMTFQVAMTPVHATLGDLYSGDDLATSMSQVQSMKGVSRIAGNPVGVWLSALGTTHAQVGAAGAALCAAASAVTQMPETLPASNVKTAKTPRRGGGSINPLNFFQLFNKSYRLGVLTIVSALADVAEFTFDVDNHLYIAVGMDSRLIGAFYMCNGVSSIVAGGVATRLIPTLGPAGYTMLANCCAAGSMLVRSFARTPLTVFLSLIPYTFGPMGTRSSCVNSLHTAEATSAGLAMGELVAARANFFTVLKMLVPLGYARLYAYGQRFPYMFAAGLIGLAQLMLLTIKGRGAPLAT